MANIHLPPWNGSWSGTVGSSTSTSMSNPGNPNTMATSINPIRNTMGTSNNPSAAAAAAAEMYRRPRVLLGVTGSATARTFPVICQQICVWADVKAVATIGALHFVERLLLPRCVELYTDDTQFVGARIEPLQAWADILVIAPLSASTLAKITGGMCDNLLTYIVRAWDHHTKPVFVAPSMPIVMWGNSIITDHQFLALDMLGINRIPAVPGSNEMFSPDVVCATVRNLFPSLFAS